MTENCGIDVLPTMNESFTSSQHDSNDEEEFVVRRKKKTDMFSDDEDGKRIQENASSDLNESNTPNKNASSQRRRRIQLDESSDEEDVSQPKDDQLGSMLNNGSAIQGENNDDGSSENHHDNKDGDDSSQDGSNRSSDSDDEEAPPLRLFRNKNATTVTEGRNLNTQDEDTYDNEMDEDMARPDPSEISERQTSKRQSLPRRASMFALQSETQRLVRESSVNLPYHRPPQKRLSDFMKRPIIGNEKCDNINKVSSKFANEPAIVDDLPDIGTVSSKAAEIDTLKSNDDGEISVENASLNIDGDAGTSQPTEENVPKRPLTKRERLLQLIGPRLPKLTPRSLQKEPVLIDFEEEDKKKEVNTGVMMLMKRFLKHASIGKENQKPKKDVVINIIRKEDKSDGSGIELVPDVVTTNTTKTEPVVENGYNLSGKQCC